MSSAGTNNKVKCQGDRCSENAKFALIIEVTLDSILHKTRLQEFMSCNKCYEKACAHGVKIVLKKTLQNNDN